MRAFIFTCLLFAVFAPADFLNAQTPSPLPDLILWHVAIKPFTQTKSFASNSCEVIEGCMSADTHRLLRFNIETRNQGSADLILGPPENNPLFEYAPCHGHYHFRNFVIARLFDSNDVSVATGSKIGFCLTDSYRWDTNASPQSLYHCGFQGIQRGWADDYAANLSCQYIDITDVPAGEYTLELEVDPDNRLSEGNEDNNIVRVPVILPGPCNAPVPNDTFESASPITSARAQLFGNSNCATTDPGEAPIIGSLGRSVWFRWTAPFNGQAMISTDGTTFDSVLGVYTGPSPQDLAKIGENDDGGYGHNALVRFETIATTVYRVKVDGYQGVGGDYTLNIIPGNNDNFQSCAPLPGAVGLIRDYTIYATAEFGEPAHADNAAIHSLWYCWTAPFTGPVTFDTDGSLFDTVLAVYTGSSLSALTRVAANDNYQPPWTTSRLTFNATSNTLYRVAVDGRNSSVGMLILRWGPPFRLRANNALQLNLSGAVGDHYAIETSPNLQSWAPWKRLFNTNGTVTVSEPFSNPPSQRFYRAYLE